MILQPCIIGAPKPGLAKCPISEQASLVDAARAARAKSYSELVVAVAPAFDGIGFPSFGAYKTHLKSPTDALKPLCLRRAVTAEAGGRPIEILRSDPRFGPALTSPEPYFCSEAPGQEIHPGPSPHLIELALTAAIDDPLIVPIHTSDEYLVVALLSGPDALRCRFNALSALVLAGIFLQASLRLASSATKASGPLLSHRQLQCLDWARKGKSSTVIGQILGLSARTVDDHIGAACMALEVRTRVQAVAKSLELGLLAL